MQIDGFDVLGLVQGAESIKKWESDMGKMAHRSRDAWKRLAQQARPSVRAARSPRFYPRLSPHPRSKTC